MSNYNLGTASGRIEIDGRAGALGFKVVETAANTFFDVVKSKVDSIEQMGRRMQIAGTAGVAGFGVAVKAASSFEQQMSAVRAVAGGTEDDFESLREKALQLGADTSFSASEAALAIEELAKAGIPIEDILNGAAAGAVALAAAGGVGLAEAATIASNAMNQFGLGADEIEGVADILAGVANTSAADVSTLGQSLAQTGAVANLAGLSFKDTTIALGQLADAGIQGSDAGTSLKTMLTNLIPATDKQTRYFERLGILQYDLAKANKVLTKEGLKQAKSIDVVKDRLAAYVEEIGAGNKGTARNREEVTKLLQSNGALSNQFFDQEGKVKSLGKIQGVLAKSLKGMTKEQKLSTLEVLFGSDALRASAILAENGAKGYREFADAVGETSAADVAKERLNNLAGATDAFKGSMETAFITIGSILLPVLTKIVKGLTFLVNVFNNLPGPVKTAIAVIVGIVSIMLIMIGTILSSLTVIAAFVLQWYALRIIRIVTGYLRVFIATQRAGLGIQAAHSAALATASARTRRLGIVTRIAAKAMIFFSKAMLLVARLRFLLNPYVLIVLAIAAAAVILYKKWEPFRELVNKIAKALKDYFLKTWEDLQPVLLRAGQYLQNIGRIIARDVMPFLKEAGKAIMGALGPAFKQISDAVKNDLMPAFRDLGDTFQNDILPALKDLWAAAKPLAKIVGTVLVVAVYAIFKAMVTWADFLISTVYPILIKVFGFLTGAAVRALVQFIGGIADMVSGLITLFSGLINFFAGLFTGDWSRMWEGAQQIVRGAWNIIKGFFKIGVGVVLSLLKSLGKGLLSIFEAAFNAVDDLTGGWLSRIVGFFTGFVKTIFSIFQTGLMLLVNTWQAFWGLFGGIITGVFGVILAIIKLFWVVIKGLFLLGIMGAVAVMRVGWNIVKAVVSTALQTIVRVVRTGINIVKSVIQAAWGLIRSVTSAVWNGIKGIIDGIFGGIENKATGSTNKVKGVVSAAWNAIKTATSRIWEALKQVIFDKIGEVLSKVGSLGGDILNALGDFGSLLFNKGAELIQGLIGGIESKIDDIKNAIGNVTGAIGDFLPGSPVKEGPLTKWNRGMAGKRLMGFLADGLEDTTAIERAMRSVSTYINGVDLMVKPAMAAAPATPAVAARPTPVAVGGAVRRPKPAKKGGGTKQSRLINGELHIGPDGRVWIEGIAQDVYDENEEYKDNRDPRGGRRG